MKRIELYENKIHMLWEVTDAGEIKLLHFSALPFEENTLTSETGTQSFYPVEILVSGQDRVGERHGHKYIQTSPGYRMKYREFRDFRNERGRKLEVVTEDHITGLEVTGHYQFYDGISVVRVWTEVKNRGTEPQGLEYVSSFALNGIEKEGLREFDEKLELRIPHNAWQKELDWASYTLRELGLSSTQPHSMHRSSKTIGIGNTGNWSAKEYIPMGYLENQETRSSLFWQIEHNGSWYWEISDQDGHVYLKLSGPTEHHNHWWKNLQPGETFLTVPVSVGTAEGGFDEAMGELTKYRRAIRRVNDDNENLRVIFNDYMNCLFGDPTTEKEIPLIDKAAEAGCEYFCIDAGWYSAGYWWDGVGEWLPSKERFPGGIKEVTDYIRAKGMIPGVWLELEVMGIKCPKADRVKDDWYFMRHGKRVYDRSRYQLDFRNPQVRAHATEVIDRVVNAYGVGYIKMDYNIEPGIGTEVDADSYGDGLLGHNRAYLEWLDGIFEKYPDLIIENCSSGGLRMDYAMLSRYSIQSTSDQEDYVRYATITANAPSAVTPEQAAVWSYPLTDGDCEEVVFNMVNALLLRIHQSGHLVNLSPERFSYVKEAITYYKTIRPLTKKALPYWPLGLSAYGDPWVSLGLEAEGKDLLAVWRRDSQSPVQEIPVKHLKGKDVQAVCAYPENAECAYHWNKEAGTLTVELPARVSARIFEFRYDSER